jgi:hypothetical protein
VVHPTVAEAKRAAAFLEDPLVGFEGAANTLVYPSWITKVRNPALRRASPWMDVKADIIFGMFNEFELAIESCCHPITTTSEFPDLRVHTQKP